MTFQQNRFKMSNFFARFSVIPSFVLAVILIDLFVLLVDASDSLIVSDIPAPRGYWQNGVVPYVIDPSFTADQRAIIQQQLAKLERNVPCDSLKIRLWSPGEKDYVYIQKSETPLICAADGMGRHGGEQGLYLGSTCFDPSRQGEIMAQFMRILGFPSEHQRPDRDQYIQVFYDAVSIAHRRDYYKYSDWLPGWKSTDPYDFESVTHASDDMFAFSPQLRTFKPWYPQEKIIGSRQKLSRLDKIRLQRLFPCVQQQQQQQPQQVQQQFQQVLQSLVQPVQQSTSTVQPQVTQQQAVVQLPVQPPQQTNNTAALQLQQALLLLTQPVTTTTTTQRIQQTRQPLLLWRSSTQPVTTTTVQPTQRTTQSLLAWPSITLPPPLRFAQTTTTQQPQILQQQQPQLTEQKPKLPTLAELLLAFDKVQEISASNRKIFANNVQ